MVTAVLPVRGQRITSRAGELRTPIVGGIVIVAILVCLSVVRDLITHAAGRRLGGVDLVGNPTLHSQPLHALGLLANLIVGLAALTALGRALDRRGCRTVWHVVATLGLAMAISTLYMIAIEHAAGHAAPALRSLIGGPLKGIQIFGLWVLAFRYPQLVTDRRVRALEAERLQRDAELSRLREHLQPHFLRNTLNTIAAAVRDDPDQARDLLAALGDLLSDSLEHDQPMQPLGDEIAWLRRYSELFAARHRGALRFTWELDPAANAIQVPRLLLQPLVENAIHHGALARPDGGEVTVQTRRGDGGVVVVVADDGPGIDPRRPEGLGLHLVRRRLAIECRDGQLRLESSASGTRATVELPVMLRVLVVEDEWPARSYVVELLQQTGAAEVVAAVATLAEAQQALDPRADAAIDVAFVDIQLTARSGDLSGLDWVRAATAAPRAPMFVLATAYKQHAIEAYDLGVSDYLVKPFTAQRVAECVRRLQARGHTTEHPPAPLRIAARRQRIIVFLDLDEVWACEASERLTCVHSARGRYDLDLTLSAIGSSFGRTLLRVHRNWLINAARVLELERESGDMTLFVGSATGPDKAGVRVPVAKERAAEVRELLLERARGVRRG